MRIPDKPLPGDVVVRCRGLGLRLDNEWVLTRWPDAETVVGGPYQSYAYAFQRARRLVEDSSVWIWRDYARDDASEHLALVAGGLPT